MKLMLILLISIFTLLTACTGQTNTQPVSVEHSNDELIHHRVNQIGNNIMVIFQDKKNNYWFGSWQDGLYMYDGKFITHYTTKNGLPDNRVDEIKEDKQGNVFINTSSGLCRYDGKQLVPVPEAIASMANWKLQPDDLWFKSVRSGNVWRYDGKFLYSLVIPKSKVGEEYLANHPNTSDPYGIYCIYTDTRGNIWFGTALMGVLRYNGYSFDWISESDVTEMHEGPANGVRSIIEDKDGYFWFNAAYRYKVIDDGKLISKPFYERRESIGSLDGKKAGLLTEYLSIARDNHDNLWIATYQNGVWKYDGKVVKHVAVQENGKDIRLFCIYRDNKGDIWLGSPENGVWKLDGDLFVRVLF